jgi:hypothetical protein
MFETLYIAPGFIPGTRRERLKKGASNEIQKCDGLPRTAKQKLIRTK